MIRKFSVSHAGDREPDVVEAGRALGLADLEISRAYYIEFDTDPSDAQIAEVCAALGGADMIVEPDIPLRDGDVQIAYRKGVVDNECQSIVTMCSLLGIAARAGKAVTIYRSAAPDLASRLRQARVNPTIEELHVEEPHYKTLMPAGSQARAEHHDLRAVDEKGLRELGSAGGRNLSLAQMQRIRAIQVETGAAWVSDVLLEALDARWSDHCAHTTWKSLGHLLKRLVDASAATGNPNILSMFHDNAGVWSFYDGLAIAIKAETHNGPSAIAAYFGQLTKVGGVLRDILGTGLGADPIGSFEYTALGVPGTPAPIAGRPAARELAKDTIRAVKEYGNTFGVPMMSSRMTFHPAYRAKPFALGGSLGILPAELADKRTPQAGDLVVLIGALTGDEGIHGASASSAGATMDVGSVQIGSPLEQVKFRKALIDLRDAGCLRALTDVGGAGLNSAVGEIGEPTGVWVNTALVPLKTATLPMWRILLSESQERMLLAIPPEAHASAKRILDRHQTRSAVIGRFSGSGRYCVFHDPSQTEEDVLAQPTGAVPGEVGDLGFDVPYELLDFDVPQLATDILPVRRLPEGRWPAMNTGEIGKLLAEVVSDGEVCSQHYADSQYDSTVQGNTRHGPRYGDAHPVRSGYWAGTPVDGSLAAAVVTTAFNPWLFEIDPVDALRHTFSDVVAGQVLVGVELADVCLCDNFYTPHRSEGWAEWLVAMVDELAALVRRFGVPVLSGKDSSAGSTATDEGIVHVPPAVFLTALGKVPDVGDLVPEQWHTVGNVLALIGPRMASPAGTVAARKLGLPDSRLDPIDLEAFSRYLAALSQHRGRFTSAVRLGPGGLAVALLRGALASGLGVDVADSMASAGSLFAEHRAGALVEVTAEVFESLPPELEAVEVGRVAVGAGVRANGEELLTPLVRENWLESFARSLA
ncbi:AIR synthase-related protein [Amycolatopsis sp. cmx-11-12]|uniref:AIR synthase-related protein n=1 Tax=Amycolatopsis sp. cmx-11-12 TaxID=2785795 RepID=UPI0039184FA3